MQESYRSPLAKIRGLGAAKHGIQHFIGQRSSAVALLILAVALVLTGFIDAVRSDYQTALDWVSRPVNGLMLILSFAAICYHMRLGVQTVIEDYIHTAKMKYSLLFANTAFAITSFATASYAVLRVAGV